ncbi:MAG: ribose 5-phosphate isomerase B [Parcubacteria group bacterium Gr01-1014_44]|nr:MAG: ribose 5-phosphate isomerase B [Parcubacteria group bacterium Gr01-1014_44]
MIYLGADHRGFQLKEKIKKWLSEWGYQYEDLGALEYEENDDYPDFATAVGKAVALSLSKGDSARGVLICGSGIGVAVAANKIKGIRAGTVAKPEQAQWAVDDEDLNVLGLSAKSLSDDEAQAIVKTFLGTKFSGAERHIRRINKIKELEK